MHEDDVPPDALLQELVGERFPSWQGVLNEQVWARYRAQHQWHLLEHIARAGGPDLIPDWMRDDQISRARRRKMLNDAISEDWGRGYGRHTRPDLREAE